MTFSEIFLISLGKSAPPFNRDRCKRGFPGRGSGNKVSQTGRADCVVTFLREIRFSV